MILGEDGFYRKGVWKLKKYERGGIELLIPDDARPSPFYEVLVRAADLHHRKNTNYAGIGDDPFRNFRESEDFGIPAWKGVLVRMSDKWMRIKNLVGGVPDKVGEGLSETLIDLLVYSGLCMNLIDEEKKHG